MLYHLLYPFHDIISGFNVFRYPSFRIIGATLVSLLITFLFFPGFIRYLQSFQKNVSNVREDVPDRHQSKEGTPTMGGVFILFALVSSTLLWGDLTNPFLMVVLFITIGFGAIGFIDDYRKLRFKNSKGLSGRYKLILQILILTIAAIFLYLQTQGFLFFTPLPLDSKLSVPLIDVSKFHPDLGWGLYVPFAFFVVMGTSHALNLTDGLDGLAIAPTVVSAATFLILAYAAGTIIADFNIAYYLGIPHTTGTTELAVYCGALVGAGIGFLWYNSYPATVFMGDVGSLALGGGLGTIAVLTKNELLSVIIHGIFLAETLSVITQVASFKLTGKRIFKMAPVHHHFELKGWAEPKIIVRFWIVSIILALMAIGSLKVR